MAVARKRAGRFRVPEDITKFGGEVNTDTNNDWSLGGRINRCLANDVEYVPYMLILYTILFWTWEIKKETGLPYNNHLFIRALVYGIMIVVARYLHNLCYIFKITYGRIAGFFLTIVALFVMAMDACYYITKELTNMK